MSNRKPGYYWFKPRKESGWEIAYVDNNGGVWLIDTTPELSEENIFVWGNSIPLPEPEEE